MSSAHERRQDVWNDESSMEIERLESPAKRTEPINVALIDGSITWSIGLQERAEKAFTLPTPAGESPPFYIVRHRGVPFYYVHFHGVDFVSASGNVQVGFTRTWSALRVLGVRDVFSGAAAGSLHRDYRVGDIVVIDDFLDFSTHRPRSILMEIWERPPYIGAAFKEPTCPELRAILLQVAMSQYRDGRVHERGVLAQVEGHRFETPAEIRALKLLGGDFVAHHQASEAIYARELGMHYTALNFISNIGEGLEPGTAWASGEFARAHYALCTEILLDAVALAAQRTNTCTECPQPDTNPGNIRPEDVKLKPVWR
ncbi:MAG TPA: hypothetical protein VFD70_11375 [Anaerolineae bacterium]|nr:hypothetical protein [Anaerolineae bacterium]